jgi:ribosomal protein S18 acetylase RimI-like enzyme
MLETHRLGTDDGAALGTFFSILSQDPEVGRFFHPHPLSADYARSLCGELAGRRDRYYLTFFRGRPVAYSMLRGWDEGFAVPSFGGSVHPHLRGAGLGRLLLAHAASEAKAAGASRLRLTVYKTNVRALGLYAKFGFIFTDKNEKESIGLLDLAALPAAQGREPDLTKLNAWYAADRGEDATPADKAA